MEPDRGRIVLDREEASGSLPMVCMQCGEPTTVYKVKGFHTHQFRARRGILFLYQLISWLSSPKMKVRAPFCSIHQNHWVAQSTVIWVLAGVVALVLIGGVVIVAGLQLDPASGGGVVLLLVTTIIIVGAANIVRRLREQRGVIMVEVAPEYIVFDRVHDRFLDALEAQREAARSPMEASPTPDDLA